MKLKTNWILVIILSLITWSCQNESKDFVELSGKIINLDDNIDSIKVFIPNGYKKNIAIQQDGTFEDTLKVKEGKYLFKIGDEYGSIYLMNGDKINISTDYSDFDQKLSFDGTGSSVNKSNVQKEIMLLGLNNLTSENLALNDKAFEAKMKAYRDDYNQLKKDNSELAADFWKESDTEVEANIKAFTEERNNRLAIKNKFSGKPAPSFAMESIDGSTVKLEDFKGKYVYVDVWATWCGPCKREIPYLKELEEKYADANLAVVSISVDEPKDKKKWQDFVKDYELRGTQLFTGDGWKADFIREFEIQSIPRFILIDPVGNVVSPDAPRPSEERLQELLRTLNI